MALSVGLAGAGPWAHFVHAPLIAAGPETRLAGVWNRTYASAQALAATHGVPAFEDFDALLDACEAVAFCVAPEAQPDLAIRAARAGKTLLLEKPIAPDAAEGERLVQAVDEAGVGSLLMLTYRFSTAVRDFLAKAQGFGAIGGRACFISGAFLGGPFASSPWRQAQGALLDVGPHVIDLIDGALGPVTAVKAHGDPATWVGLLLEHESGASSEVSLSASAAIDPSRTEVELYGPNGQLSVDARAAVGPSAFALVRQELAVIAAGGTETAIDVHRGLHLQRIIDEAAAQLRRA